MARGGLLRVSEGPKLLTPSFPPQVSAVGHRVVHGMGISEPALLSAAVVAQIQDAAVLAPLHNAAGLQGIQAAQEVFGDAIPQVWPAVWAQRRGAQCRHGEEGGRHVRHGEEGGQSLIRCGERDYCVTRDLPHLPTSSQVAVFDTAFHQTMPAHAFMYGLPYELYEQHGIRRYGFHGTSHQYLVAEAARMLGKPVEATNLITCHLGEGRGGSETFYVWADVTPCRYLCLFSLNDRPVLMPSLSGNGSSLTAVQNGISIDTSMGMTPLEGWVRANVTVLLLYLCVAPRPALSPSIIIRGHYHHVPTGC